MNRLFAVSAALVAFSLPVLGQTEGLVKTQALVGVDKKSEALPTLADVHLTVDGRKEELTGWSRVPADGVQVAILIDDGLRQSVGRELDSLKKFVNGLPAETQIFIGYMRNGTVSTEQRFTTDHAAAAQHFRLPVGSPGISASPYFCLSEFVKHWPGDATRPGARFVLLITNGVDPYNGSTSPLNQNSPYVEAAQTDAQRAGVSVSSIYFNDAGFGAGRGTFSGQSYLSQVSEATGGRAYYEGVGNPVSMAPFLAQFQHAISETFVATFQARAKGNDLVSVKAESTVRGTKLRTPQAVRPGNMEIPSAE